MTSLDAFREVMRRDRVFDFMLDETLPAVDVAHGVLLYVEGLSVSFDGFKALNNLNLYVDDGADLEKATAVALNAKTQRYGTCCTLESLLLADSVAAELLPGLAKKYLELGVELRGCEKTRKIVAAVGPATEEDWAAEYLAPILSIKIVAGLDEAISHINRYSSQHTDSIMTQDVNRAQRFLREVDSSSVMVNASTRFADGFEYGLGAEIGISTDKLHARGPVGLEGLTSQKYIVIGDGHVRK